MLFSFHLSAQQQSKVVIQFEGLSKENVNVILDNKLIASNSEEENVLYDSLVVDKPLYGMVVKKNGKYAGFYIEPGATEVIIKFQGFPGSIEVPGSKSHQVFSSVKYARNKKDFITNFLEHKDDPIALNVMNAQFHFMEMTKEELEKVYHATSHKNQHFLIDLNARIETFDLEKVTEGAMMYDFIGLDKNGIEFKTKDYRGKYLLLDFAATGCGPCWAGYPDMIEETNKYKDLQVLTYNEDSAIDTWEKIAENRNIALEWPVLWEGKNKNQVFEIYNVEGWPLFFLISPEGQVLENWFGSRKGKLTKNLKKHLK
jgi:thiol-disulfide isomerase/thioredoxin